MAGTRCRASRDRRDCVSERALSRDCLEIDIGLVSAMEPDWEALRDISGRHAVAKLPKMSGMEAEREEREGLGV